MEHKTFTTQNKDHRKFTTFLQENSNKILLHSTFTKSSINYTNISTTRFHYTKIHLSRISNTKETSNLNSFHHPLNRGDFVCAHPMWVDSTPFCDMCVQRAPSGFDTCASASKTMTSFAVNVSFGRGA